MPPTFVQLSMSGSQSGTTTLAYSSNNTAGNLLVAFAVCTGGTLTAISDTNSNTWTSVFFGTIAPQTTEPIGVAYALNCHAGANTVQRSGTATSVGFFISEYSGLATVSALDTSNETASQTTSATSCPITTTSNGDLIIAWCWAGVNSGITSMTDPSGYTARGQFQDSTFARISQVDKVQATAGSTDASFTLGLGVSWDEAVLAFRIPSVSGGGWVNSQRAFINKRK